MLPKDKRLTSECFEEVYESGRSISGDLGYIKIHKTDECSGIVCVAPQSDTHGSVDRTRIRRRGYAAVEKNLDLVPDGYGIIWFLPARARDTEFSLLVDSFRSLIKSARETID